MHFAQLWKFANLRFQCQSQTSTLFQSDPMVLFCHCLQTGRNQMETGCLLPLDTTVLWRNFNFVLDVCESVLFRICRCLLKYSFFQVWFYLFCTIKSGWNVWIDRWKLFASESHGCMSRNSTLWPHCSLTSLLTLAQMMSSAQDALRVSDIL